MSVLQALALAFILLLLYSISTILYRLLLHPLSRFPGPKLASLTYKTEFYHEAFRNGHYTHQIRSWHRRYGPIIRINPTELHIDDVFFIDQIYAGAAKKRDKFAYDVNGLGFGSTALGAITHERHRELRGPMNRFFSKAAVARLEPAIVATLHRFVECVEANAGKAKPLNVGNAWACWTTEVISEYCFGRGAGFLEKDGFEDSLRPALHGLVVAGPVVRQWPFLFDVLRMLPDALVYRLLPGFQRYNEFVGTVAEQVAMIQEKQTSGDYEKRAETNPTIFHELLASDWSPEDKQSWRLVEEGRTLVGAGTETTGWAASVATFHILDKPWVLKKLRAELEAANVRWTALPPSSQLEQLPYLNATVYEALRLSYGVGARTTRVAREPVVYRSSNPTYSAKEWIIPPNTPMSMTNVLTHHNEEIFSDSWTFRPERWLDGSGKRQHERDKFLMSFSRGSRQCLGMNLALTEMLLAVTTLALRLADRMELHETSEEEDVRFDHAYFIPFAKSGTDPNRGIRVLVL